MKQVSRLILLLVAFMAGLPAFAASRQVTGTVTDEQGEPLVGASVMLVNSRSGCMADIDGNFSLQVPDGAASLKIALIGYQPQTVKVAANQTSVKVVLKEDAQTLEETVVVGYGTQKKVNLTGAVASVEGKSLENRPAANITNMLQGTVSGLNVTTSSGLPGSSADLNIRGQASINGGSPLVLVDGSIGSIDNVNPNDVASISVIKDASAAAVYGARAAFGVILVTTKNGNDKEGKATVRYNGRFGWQEPTVSREYENTGFWSVYLVNKFYTPSQGKQYVQYDNNDMMELLARVNDKTENPDRPWIIETTKSGRPAWKYYCNTDWYDTFFRDKWFSQQHNVSLSGGMKGIRYFISGGLNSMDGLMKVNGDKYHKYNLRAKVDFPVNKWITVSNNTSFYGSTYEYLGSKEGFLQGFSRHALAYNPIMNPDGSYPFDTDWQNNNIANCRHIMAMEGKSKCIDRKTDFTNVFGVDYKPIPQLTIHGDFTYRFNQGRNTQRNVNLPYRTYPGQAMQYYGNRDNAGRNNLVESVGTYNYYSANGLATYSDTFNEKHNVKVMAGYNYETRNYKNVGASAWNLISNDLSDFSLVGTDSEGKQDIEIEGGQNQYSLQGIFGRINYDYMGKYLVEISGRYDGSSRFPRGQRWGMFPSGSLGWRFSQENFFEPLQQWWSNGKLRFSYGTLGNQNVSDYYTFLRKVGTSQLDGDNNFAFSSSSIGTYATLGSPLAGDLTWEKTYQYDLGLDLAFFNNRLDFTGDLYIRDTKDMLAPGVALPAVYGATSPKMNVADLRTKGYELAINWNDQLTLFGNKFTYGVGFNLSDYKSTITKYDNPTKSFSKDYYVGQELGEVWVYKTDGFFKTNEEAQEYTSRIDHSYNEMSKYVGSGWQAGDLKFVDVNGDGKIDVGGNTVDDSGDRYKYGNSLPHLSYGFRANFSYFGFDVSAFFQGTGNHYQYINGYNYDFWGCYSWSYLSFIPTDFKDKIWSEDNPNAYFPRAMGYQTTGGYLKPAFANDHYIQNLRYLRFKNLTVGYTLPQKWTRKAYMEKVRLYFTGENLCYWSPLKKNSKYVDPEAVGTHSSEANNMFYPWAKSFMFGLDVTF